MMSNHWIFYEKLIFIVPKIIDCSLWKTSNNNNEVSPVTSIQSWMIFFPIFHSLVLLCVFKLGWVFLLVLRVENVESWKIQYTVGLYFMTIDYYLRFKSLCMCLGACAVCLLFPLLHEFPFLIPQILFFILFFISIFTKKKPAENIVNCFFCVCICVFPDDCCLLFIFRMKNRGNIK